MYNKSSEKLEYQSNGDYEGSHNSLTFIKDDFKDLDPQKLIEFKEEYSKPFFQ